MPTGKNWLIFIYVNIGFVVYIIAMYYFISLKQIKDNWPEYRCNPMYMPLSDNIQKDFVYCIQTMQSNYMGYLLQPLTFSTASLTNMAGNFSQEINNVRNMFNQTRNFLTSAIQNIFGVFLNMIIEFQKIIIGIKDLVSKLVGIMITLLYILDGSTKTTKSMWNGPPGQMVRSLGKCFHPNTKIKLKNGVICCIKDINLGDILDNGSRVNAVMKIDNANNADYECLYKLINRGVDNEDILITGSHLIFDNTQNKYIEIKNYKDAVITNIQTSWLCCLITDNHKIQVGKDSFWDWEDYIIKLQK
jgi:hypothetical protein